MKILIIIPSYNEASNIVNVIESLKSENPKWDIIVINDCSMDNTGDIAESTGKAYVLNLPVNLGIGGAVQTGFKYAKRVNYDIAIKFDGDGQHIASEIYKLLNPIVNGEADVVIGSRFCERNKVFKSTFTRRIGIKILEIVNSLLIKQRITDNTSGFIAFNKKAIHFFADYYPTDYPEPESIVILGKNGFKIKEIPTVMQMRQGGVSSIKGCKSIYYMLKVLLSVFMSIIRKKIVKE
ncbi:MAG: glycosyltransferase family 2 protein [Candidatus Aminicenantes bacterium]|jgi:glycosyltransferase involved in cell wall biosynthesis